MLRSDSAFSADIAPGRAASHGLNPRIWLTLCGLYVAQAIPLYLVAAALPPILRAKGVDLSLIGGLGILMLPWVLKPLWAPWIDRLSRHPRIGRKGVILAMQLVVLATLPPFKKLWLI